MDNLVLCNMTDEEKRDYNFDLNDNCYWYEYQDCYYLIVKPDGNTVWWHSNFEERY